MCLGCYKILTSVAKERHICQKCSWPLCSESCESSPEHLPECEIFSTKSINVPSEKFKYNGEVEPLYDVVAPVRVLWQRDHEPEKFLIFWKLMSHVDNWMKSKEWIKSHEKITKFILEVLKFGK